MKPWRGAVVACAATLLVTNAPAMGALLGLFFPSDAPVLYPLATPLQLYAQHLALSVLASLASGVVGFAAGLAAHYRKGPVKELVFEAGALVQTLPPVAVLAMLVPVLGFGNRPVLVALALYGLLPVVHGTASGLDSVPADVLDAARGLGMGAVARLFAVELPLALPAIAAGVRTSMVINVGTAAIGATMGAGGLGRPIMAGLVQFRTAYVVQGALAAAVLALSLDWLLATLERGLSRSVSGPARG